jgi:flagellar biosynthetic protein FliR
MTLETLLMTQLYAFLLVFSRVGAAFMTLPGFSDATISPQIRLLFALAFALVLSPLLFTMLPSQPSSVFGLVLLIIHEMLIGIFIGSLVQIIMSALAFSGFLIATSMSMSNAVMFSPTMSSSNTVISTFMMLLGVTLFFVMDLHHQVLLGLIDSYTLLPPTEELFTGDMAQHLAEVIGESLMLGLRIAAPFLVVIIGILFAMGLMARMVPQIQVFVMSVPVQMLVGSLTLITVLSSMMLYFMGEFDLFLKNFLTGQG